MVTKVPRFTFEKFTKANARLTTQMKSVGEVMAIGRTFQESVQKALRGLEEGKAGFDPIVDLGTDEALATIRQELLEPGSQRIWYVGDAFRAGMSVDQVFEISAIDRWYLAQIEDLIKEEQTLAGRTLTELQKEELFRLKRKGFSDARLADLLGVAEADVRRHREALELFPRLQAGGYLCCRVRFRHRLHVLHLRAGV